ncbi:hypothetical protein AVEN_234825-1 [Araneus ventricosus]|uniref:Uncharacterized protein n=1 Tax=Araneus ventricosus TaxID=182803 RepID=A0A4Y2F4T6_ARAVE|nr:hypothetical protein AVEN_234825-1 [Araneus ventricosus]
MSWTRAMDEKFEKLFAMMAEMKAGLEYKMEAGQEEMKAGQEEMKVLQEETKAGLEKKMEAGQERMENIQKEMKDLIRAGKEEMGAHVTSQVEGIKDHVDGCIGRMEEEVQGVKGKIEEVKTEFDVLSSTNGWTDFAKASQLVVSLRGSEVEVLQGIPTDKLTDLTTIEKALESRFRDSHLTQFYRTELKTRRQKPGESLQELAADVERLMSLAYAECPLDFRESLGA